VNQKDAVFEEIKKIKPAEVDQDKPVVLSKAEKEIIQQRLFEGFKSRKIQYNQEMPSNDKLALYISGLVSNWLRKDPRLNGHTTYMPGRRRGVPPSIAGVQVDGGRPHLTEEQFEAVRHLLGDDAELLIIRKPAHTSARVVDDQAAAVTSNTK
jgi:hypothetical protein